MFARVFDTARRVFSRSPSASAPNLESVESSPKSFDADTEANAAMVTTRRATDTPGTNTPRSSVRKTTGKREFKTLQTQDTPKPAKRIRKSVDTPQEHPPLEVAEARQPTPEASTDADNENGLYDNILVTMPDRTKEKTTSPAPEERPPSGRRSPKVLIQRRSSPPRSPQKSPIRRSCNEDIISASEMEPHTPVQSSSVFVTPATHLDRRTSVTPNAKSHIKKSSPVSALKSRSRKTFLEVSAEEHDYAAPEAHFSDVIPASASGTEQAQAPRQESVGSSPSYAQKQHKRFGSEDLEQNFDISEQPVIVTERQQQEDNDDAASDSDEAPETITAANATSKAFNTASRASRAHLAQQAKDQQRKERRAARIAEEQAEKRKREEKKARRLAKIRAREERGMESTDDVPPKEPLDIDMRNLPALLPDSLLEAVGDHRAPAPPPTQTGKTAEQLRNEVMKRHIKFMERGEMPVNDVKKGSIHVSVLAQQNALLPQKTNRRTKKGIREEWLKGRRVEKLGGTGKQKGRFDTAKMKRKRVGSGFLRGGDD